MVVFPFAENPQRAEEIQKVDEKVLNFMSKLQEKDEHIKSLGTSAVQYQGIYFSQEDFITSNNQKNNLCTY